MFTRMQEALQAHNPKLKMVDFKGGNLIFEERVHVKCFYCSRYSTKWSCPPRIPNIWYEDVMGEYSHAAFVIAEQSLSGTEYEEARERSTNELHKGLLFLEQVLWANDNPMALSFIGGSCKLCKGGCAPDQCRNPGLKRIPLEATGCNVIKSLATIGITVSFLPSDVIRRYGLLLW